MITKNTFIEYEPLSFVNYRKPLVVQFNPYFNNPAETERQIMLSVSCLGTAALPRLRPVFMVDIFTTVAANTFKMFDLFHALAGTECCDFHFILISVRFGPFSPHFRLCTLLQPLPQVDCILSPWGPLSLSLSLSL